MNDPRDTKAINTPETARLRERLGHAHKGAYVTVVFTLALPRVLYVAGEEVVAVDQPSKIKLAAGPFPGRSVCDAARELIRAYSRDRTPTIRALGSTIVMPVHQMSVRDIAIHALTDKGGGFQRIEPEVPLTLGDIAILDAPDEPEGEDGSEEPEES